jgi:CRISPR-associated protein Csb2
VNTRCLLPADLVPDGSQAAVQFAVGGLALPPPDQWLSITERFRGRVVKGLCRRLTGNPDARYRDLTAPQRLSISLVSGKDSFGKPLSGHRHSCFFLAPDEFGQPCRLVVWRRSVPFSHDEVQALLRAVERPVLLEASAIYLVPLPLGTRLPASVRGPARIWRSGTPFVPPATRHRYRGGRLRARETVERLAERFLSDLGLPSVESITAYAAKPVRLHLPHKMQSGPNPAAARIRAGYEVRVGFSEPAEGPILMGDSCHFGLGLLCCEEGTHS